MTRNLVVGQVQSIDFLKAWVMLLKKCVESENPLCFGDIDEPKSLRGEICSRAILSSNAVRQILNGAEFLGKSPLIPFGKAYIEKYKQEYTLEFIDAQRKLPDGHAQKFVYNYFDRFWYYPTIGGTFNQVLALKKGLGEQIQNAIFSNRHQMITWVPHIDAFSPSPPCLQRIWITALGGNSVEVHLDWRSRDLYGAWHVNLVALINMVDKFIVKPNNCKIVRVVDYCDSLHIYNGDWQTACKVVEDYGI